MSCGDSHRHKTWVGRTGRQAAILTETDSTTPALTGVKIIHRPNNKTIYCKKKEENFTDQNNGSHLRSQQSTRNTSQDQEARHLHPAQITANNSTSREGFEARGRSLRYMVSGESLDCTARPLEFQMGIRRWQGTGGGGTSSGSPPASKGAGKVAAGRCRCVFYKSWAEEIQGLL
jgi:hypothetical protein